MMRFIRFGALAPKLVGFLESEFAPYWQGESDFEGCYQSFLGKLRLYREE